MLINLVAVVEMMTETLLRRGHQRNPREEAYMQYTRAHWHSVYDSLHTYRNFSTLKRTDFPFREEPVLDERNMTAVIDLNDHLGTRIADDFFEAESEGEQGEEGEEELLE
jgi:hypothetical protein